MSRRQYMLSSIVLDLQKCNPDNYFCSRECWGYGVRRRDWVGWRAEERACVRARVCVRVCTCARVSVRVEKHERVDLRVYII